ncbi:hypothetical protein HQ545_00685 [Candidatus Woesearchaeota archaeon]|nr:hypothetical protein [Candidatus Woesearchaeota archaeon]
MDKEQIMRLVKRKESTIKIRISDGKRKRQEFMLCPKMMARLWHDYGTIKLNTKPPKINECRDAVLVTLNRQVQEHEKPQSGNLEDI